MTGRGRTLADARTAFHPANRDGFQFQVVGARSPLFTDACGIGLADIGLLIGLYFAPGIVMLGACVVLLGVVPRMQTPGR